MNGVPQSEGRQLCLRREASVEASAASIAADGGCDVTRCSLVPVSGGRAEVSNN